MEVKGLTSKNKKTMRMKFLVLIIPHKNLIVHEILSSKTFINPPGVHNLLLFQLQGLSWSLLYIILLKFFQGRLPRLPVILSRTIFTADCYQFTVTLTVSV